MRLLATLMLAVAISPLCAAAENGGKHDGNDSGKDGPSAKELILRAVTSYVDAYNRGDAQAVASHWSEEGEWLSPDGRRIRGRKAIAAAMAEIFQAAKGLKIEIVAFHVRQLSDDVASEEGTVRVTAPGQPPRDADYLALHVQRDGKWLMDSVRETAVASPLSEQAPEGLRQLEWLVGEWVDQARDAQVETKVEWTSNRRFLTANFKLSAAGAEDLAGVQVIGWDPAAGVIRSWMFDSDGGFGQGVWSRKGDRWLVQFEQVLAEGRKASATNIYRFIDGKSYGWQSIGRQVDGHFAPNVDEIRVIRTGTEPARPAEGKPAAKK